MDSKKLLAAVAVAFAVLTGCSSSASEGSCGGSAGPDTLVAIQSGNYSAVGEPGSGKSLEVDRAAGVMRRSYQKDGKNVVETWAIK